MTHIPLQQMLSVVEQYIFIRKGVQVRVIPPKDDKELQMLGLAYDIASQNMGVSFDYTFVSI